MTVQVLAIDDSRTMRNLLNATLSSAGFEVELAEDGEDGLRRFDQIRSRCGDHGHQHAPP